MKTGTIYTIYNACYILDEIIEYSSEESFSEESFILGKLYNAVTEQHEIWDQQVISNEFKNTHLKENHLYAVYQNDQYNLVILTRSYLQEYINNRRIDHILSNTIIPFDVFVKYKEFQETIDRYFFYKFHEVSGKYYEVKGDINPNDFYNHCRSFKVISKKLVQNTLYNNTLGKEVTNIVDEYDPDHGYSICKKTKVFKNLNELLHDLVNGIEYSFEYDSCDYYLRFDAMILKVLLIVNNRNMEYPYSLDLINKLISLEYKFTIEKEPECLQK